MRRIAFFYPSLPKRSLSQNARVRHEHNSDAVLELRAGATDHMMTIEAVRLLTAPFERARIGVTWHLTNRRPSITQCPRCLHWALEHPRSNKDRCLCYRPADPFNAIGALKPFFDGITDAGVWPDDSWEHVEVGRFARQLVGALEEEGLAVEIEELAGAIQEAGE